MDIKILASSSAGNCYRINDGSTSLLLECGIKYQEIERKLNYKIDFSACLISHGHSDHSLCAKELLKCGIEIYTSLITANEIGISGYGVNYLESSKQYKIGTLSIIPFDLVHFHNDGEECKNFGYLIYSHITKEKLLFATDTAYIHNQFKGLTHIMIETNYISDYVNQDQISAVEKRRYMSHQSLETAVEFLKSTDLSTVEKIYAIHLSHEKTDRLIIKQKLQEVTGKLVIVC